MRLRIISGKDRDPEILSKGQLKDLYNSKDIVIQGDEDVDVLNIEDGRKVFFFRKD